MIEIRLWRPEDGPACQQLIVGVLQQYGLKPDVAGVDADVLDVERHYREGGGEFFVVLADGNMVGTMGISRINEATCELRKMYLAKSARGQGLGKELLQLAEDTAKRAGFRVMQLETASVLKEAIALYEKHGFERSNNAVHTCRCDRMYQKNL